jgi:hypothetical protein
LAAKIYRYPRSGLYQFVYNVHMSALADMCTLYTNMY